MKKHLMTATVALVALTIAGTASATQTRINSMGGGVKQITVLDERNIFALPAELVKWGTWTGIEIGGPGFTSFGIHYNFNPTTVLAIYGSNQNRNALVDMPWNGETGPSSTMQGNGNAGDGNTHKLTAIFAMDLGATRLGFRLGIWGDKKATFDDSGTESSNQGPLVIDFGVGAGFALGSADLDLGLDFAYRAPTDVGNKAEVLSNNSQIDIGLLGRLTVPFSGPHELVSFLDLNLYFANGQLTGDGTDAHSSVGFRLALGTDIRLNLADGIIVQPGIGVAFQNFKHTVIPGADNAPIIDDTHNVFAVPFYNVAVDVEVTDWFDIRFGGGQEVLFLSNETFSDGGSTGSDSSTDVRHHIATGVGFNLPAGVSIDIEVDANWWKQGPYLITGNSGTFGMNAAISKDW